MSRVCHGAPKTSQPEAATRPSVWPGSVCPPITDPVLAIAIAPSSSPRTAHAGRIRARSPSSPTVVGRVMTLKIGVYLTDDVARRFNLEFRRSRTTKSALVNEALARFLNPPAATEPGHEVHQVLSAFRLGRSRPASSPHAGGGPAQDHGRMRARVRVSRRPHRRRTDARGRSLPAGARGMGASARRSSRRVTAATATGDCAAPKANQLK